MSKSKHHASGSQNQPGSKNSPAASAAAPAPAKPTSSPSSPATLDQQRAKHAWEAIESIATQDGAASDYGREAKKMPVRILTSGLGAALAFVSAKSKKKKGMDKLLANLSDWVLKKRGLQAQDPSDLMQAILKGDSEFLRLATAEVMAYLIWLNRFAEAKGIVKDEDHE